MKNTQLKKSKAASFFTGKGFYIAVCISILVVGATAYFALNAQWDNITEQNSSNLSSDGGNLNSGLQVGESQSNVPKDSSSVSQITESKVEDSSEQETSASETQQTQATSQSEPKKYSNTFVTPLQGDIINPFSNGELVKSKTLNEWRTHDGVDIKADIATPVKSASDGVVKEILQDPQWGVVIVVDHGNGYESYYMGLNVNVNVKKEDEVDIGTVLGSVGQTAEIEIAEEPHLHFAIKKDGKWIDPMSLMKTA